MEEDEDVESFSVESSCKSESKESTILSIECAKRGSTRAYQTKAENINVLQNVNPDKKIKSSFQAGDQIDKVMSGESLYKTFTFEQSSHEEDIEKCIAFWKNVMHKNLEPIKCTIIESNKTRKSQEEPHEKVSLSQLEKKHAEEIKRAEGKVHEFYKTMWNNTLQQIQRRKLDQIKLMGKSRCKMCETQISDTAADLTVSKKEIEELNTWHPQVAKKGSASHLTKRKTSVTAEPAIPVAMPEACICETPQETLSTETIIADRIHIPPDTNRYRLVDVIEKKKRDGTYSLWRKGIVTPCTCGVDVCDCNVNPAIVGIEPEEPNCGCGYVKCHCKVHKKVHIEEGKDDVSTAEAVEGLVDVQAHYCTCGHEFCACNKPDVITESLMTVDVLPTVVESVAAESIMSKDTISFNIDEEIPLDCMHAYDIGSIKRDSKANVTKTTNEWETSSVDIPKYVSDPPKCVCQGECQCKKAETTEETDEEAETVLQLQKSNKK